MQAVILCAGKGLRMLPLTENAPKSLLQVSGKTILERTLLELPDQVNEVIIVVGYCGEQIQKLFADQFGNKKITYVEENTYQGTGFAVNVCKHFIKGDFLVLNGDDLYQKSDLEKLTNNEANAMLTKDVSSEKDFPQNYKRFGKILVDEHGNYLNLDVNGETNPPFPVATGAYKVSTEFFNYPLAQLKSGEYGLPQTLFSMTKEIPLKIVPAEFWIPIGFPEDLKKAETILQAKQ
jgi:UDP-N-acetylglucosamine diphosphorylase / glucose-1-phosphate thymidylyltransferase / UDP-N-acetylgalactosamine diphosphorylase / glucosamine-1-phosphate N-acetyltransferase / galactosamine-1-phosphate N-acetyltransferase